MRFRAWGRLTSGGVRMRLHRERRFPMSDAYGGINDSPSEDEATGRGSALRPAQFQPRPNPRSTVRCTRAPRWTGEGLRPC